MQLLRSRLLARVQLVQRALRGDALRLRRCHSVTFPRKQLLQKKRALKPLRRDGAFLVEARGRTPPSILWPLLQVEHRMPRAAAPGCSQPEVAVCVVGQLRAAARPKLARNLRATWDRVGPGCVDLYLHIGLEAQVATANHRAARGSSYENASVAAIALRPIEWRATTYPLVLPNANCTMDDGGGAAFVGHHPSATVCQKRPFNEKANQTETGCGHASCTHCSASAYFPQGWGWG